MADPICDFVPAECAALAIQACIIAKKCALEQIGTPSLQAQLGGANTLNASLRLELDTQAQCVLDAMRTAFEAAGCPFPPLPNPPSLPDLTPCDDQMAAIAADASDPLGFLSGVMTIELDENDKPIRITVP